MRGVLNRSYKEINGFNIPCHNKSRSVHIDDTNGAFQEVEDKRG